MANILEIPFLNGPGSTITQRPLHKQMHIFESRKIDNFIKNGWRLKDQGIQLREWKHSHAQIDVNQA